MLKSEKIRDLGDATEAYHRECKRQGVIPRQPANDSPQMWYGWRLKNCKGVLTYVTLGGERRFHGGSR